MANEQLKQLISQGVAALKAGSKVAAAATDEIKNDAAIPNSSKRLSKATKPRSSGRSVSTGH
jgi:hypothetical protein